MAARVSIEVGKVYRVKEQHARNSKTIAVSKVFQEGPNATIVRGRRIVWTPERGGYINRKREKVHSWHVSAEVTETNEHRGHEIGAD